MNTSTAEKTPLGATDSHTLALLSRPYISTLGAFDDAYMLQLLKDWRIFDFVNLLSMRMFVTTYEANSVEEGAELACIDYANFMGSVKDDVVDLLKRDDVADATFSGTPLMFLMGLEISGVVKNFHLVVVPMTMKAILKEYGLPFDVKPEMVYGFVKEIIAENEDKGTDDQIISAKYIIPYFEKEDDVFFSKMLNATFAEHCDGVGKLINMFLENMSDWFTQSGIETEEYYSDLCDNLGKIFVEANADTKAYIDHCKENQYDQINNLDIKDLTDMVNNTTESFEKEGGSPMWMFSILFVGTLLGGYNGNYLSKAIDVLKYFENMREGGVNTDLSDELKRYQDIICKGDAEKKRKFFDKHVPMTVEKFRELRAKGNVEGFNAADL